MARLSVLVAALVMSAVVSLAAQDPSPESFHIVPGAPVVVSRTVHIAAPIDRVWNVLTGVDRWHRWNPKISHSYAAGPLGAGARFRFTSAVSVRAIVEAWDPPRRLGWRGTTFGAASRAVWTLRPDGPTATTVHTSESMTGVVASLMHARLEPALKDGLAEWQKRLKQVCESGSGG